MKRRKMWFSVKYFLDCVDKDHFVVLIKLNLDYSAIPETWARIGVGAEEDYQDDLWIWAPILWEKN